MEDDATLWAAWAAGDRKAGERLIDRYLRPISGFFANKAVAAGDIEDMVAMTFERCSRSLTTLRDHAKVRSYLFGIAANVLRDSVRKRRPDPQGSLQDVAIADLGPSPSVVAVAREEERLLLAGLRAIPMEHQLVLEMAMFEDLSRAEIADALGLPEGTVASRTRKARELLAAAVERLATSPVLLKSTTTRLDAWAESVRATLRR